MLRRPTQRLLLRILESMQIMRQYNMIGDSARSDKLGTKNRRMAAHNSRLITPKVNTVGNR